MSRITISVRFLGLIMTMIGCALIVILYYRVPWSIDVTAFFVRPLFFFVLPIIITGISLLLRRNDRHLKFFYPITVILISCIGVVALWQWPNSNSQYFWEDSHQTLSILEIAYIHLSVPFLWACGNSVVNYLPKKIINTK